MKHHHCQLFTRGTYQAGRKGQIQAVCISKTVNEDNVAGHYQYHVNDRSSKILKKYISKCQAHIRFSLCVSDDVESPPVERKNMSSHQRHTCHNINKGIVENGHIVCESSSTSLFRVVVSEKLHVESEIHSYEPLDVPTWSRNHSYSWIEKHLLQIFKNR